jgi:hypothetical protein
MQNSFSRIESYRPGKDGDVLLHGKTKNTTSLMLLKCLGKSISAFLGRTKPIDVLRSMLMSLLSYFETKPVPCYLTEVGVKLLIDKRQQPLFDYHDGDALVVAAVAYARANMDLPHELSIHITEIKGEVSGTHIVAGGVNMILLDLRGVTTSQVLLTLFHELVHANQAHLGWLCGRFDPQKNRVINHWHGVPFDVPYDEEPWEKEAFAIEQILFDGFDHDLFTNQLPVERSEYVGVYW